MQHKNTIQAWATVIHQISYPGITTKQRWRNPRHVHYHQCNRTIHGHTRLHDSRRNKDSNTRWWTHRHAVQSHDWPLSKSVVRKDPKPYWSFRKETAIIDNIAMKDIRIIIPAALQERTLKQMHLNHTDIEKRRLLVCESICQVTLNTDVGEIVQNCPTCLDFPATCLKDKTMSHELIRFISDVM